IPICKNLYHFLLCHSSDTITTYIYTLSLHDALPILPVSRYIKYDVTFESGLTLCVSKKFLPYPNSIHYLLRNWNREDACEYGFPDRGCLIRQRCSPTPQKEWNNHPCHSSFVFFSDLVLVRFCLFSLFFIIIPYQFVCRLFELP